MTVRGTWEVKITRRDGSEHCYTEHKPREPRRSEIIETTDTAGRPLRAEIKTVTALPRPGSVGLGIWQVSAIEI